VETGNSKVSYTSPTHYVYKFHAWAVKNCPENLGDAAVKNLQLILFCYAYTHLLMAPLEEIPLHMSDEDGIIIAIVKYRLTVG